MALTIVHCLGREGIDGEEEREGEKKVGGEGNRE